MLASLLVTCASVPRVSIAPGVEMPLLNFGFQKDHAAAIKLGVRGLDTALTYGDAQQQEVGKAVRESGVARTGQEGRLLAQHVEFHLPGPTKNQQLELQAKSNQNGVSVTNM